MSSRCRFAKRTKRRRSKEGAAQIANKKKQPHSPRLFEQQRILTALYPIDRPDIYRRVGVEGEIRIAAVHRTHSADAPPPHAPLAGVLAASSGQYARSLQATATDTARDAAGADATVPLRRLPRRLHAGEDRNNEFVAG